MSKETSKAVVVAAQQAVAKPSALDFSPEQVLVIKDQIAKDVSDAELHFFLEVCKATGLDPLRREIHAVMRYHSKYKREIMTIQVGIDGLRGQAESTGKYAGQLGPFWCGKDGVWTDVWLQEGAPFAAKVSVINKDFPEPLSAVAHFKSYCQTYWNKETNRREPMGLWNTMPESQLAKCAEALALRRAFPRNLKGLYIPEELDQMENDMPVEVIQQRQQEKATKALTSATTNVPAETVQLIREAAHKVGATPETANECIEKLSAKWPTLDEAGRKKAVEDILGPWRERWYEIKAERKAKANERKTAGAPKPAAVEQPRPQQEPAPQQPTGPPSDHVMRQSPWRANRPDASPANFGAASKAVATQEPAPKSADEFVESTAAADDDDGWSKTQQFLGREPGDEPPEEFEEEPF